MSSLRESIAQNIVASLKDQKVYKLGLVTREPTQDLSQLAKTAFPCVVISSANEIRNDITQGSQQILRESLADYQLTIYVVGGGKNLDTQKNELIEAVELILDQDRTRGGNALYTELISVDQNNSVQQPYSSMILTIRVAYHYTRGQA